MMDAMVPDEIWESIVMYLPPMELKTMVLVNKQFYQVINKIMNTFISQLEKLCIF